jgi:hypothetical protein
MDDALRRRPRALAIAAVVAVLALLAAVSAWAASGSGSSGRSDPPASAGPPAFQPVQQQEDDPAPPAREDCPERDGSGSGQSAPSASPSAAPGTSQDL